MGENFIGRTIGRENEIGEIKRRPGILTEGGEAK